MRDGRPRGVFEGLPRLVFRRTGARYVHALALASVVNGVSVSQFATVTLLLYVDAATSTVLLFAACSAAWYVVESLAAARFLYRHARPLRAWLACTKRDSPRSFTRDAYAAGGSHTRASHCTERDSPRSCTEGDTCTERDSPRSCTAGSCTERDSPRSCTADAQAAWTAAAQLPNALLRRPGLYLIGAAGAWPTAFLLADRLELPATEALLLIPASTLLYVYSAVLRYIALELSMRPVLEDIGAHLPMASPAEHGARRFSLHQRLVATIPIVTWGAGVIVAGLLTDDARDLDTLARATLVAIGVAAAVSLWLSLVLADAVSGPIIDLRDATRKVAAGDLDVRVPVVCTDETGELAASFNAMVAGLSERARLHEAFGAFVDPSLTERVLAEGTDLRGEELEVSVLFVDVRDFTAFAEKADAQLVVASLNALYEAVVPVILRHGGHANKFIGDGLLAVFGAPVRHPDHAARAVAAAREIAVLARDGPLRVGVGVNTGRAVVGTIGGGGRRDFTVIGDPVNTAARVEAATRETGDEILITEFTLRAIDDGADFEERPAIALRGKSESVRLYALRGS